MRARAQGNFAILLDGERVGPDQPLGTPSTTTGTGLQMLLQTAECAALTRQGRR
jgi:hypothetical protein